MSERQRAALLRASAALYGLAVAISLHDVNLRAAPPGQLPGLMGHLGYDAASSFRFVALLIVLPILFVIVLGRVLDLLARDDVEQWARNTAGLACIVALWTAILARDPAWVGVPAAVVIAVAVELRHLPAQFRRTDVVLLPSALSAFIALSDLTSLGVHACGILATALVLTLRLSVVRINAQRGLEPSLCFALAPLSLIAETHFFSYDQRHLGWPALAMVIVTPFVIRIALRDSAAVRAAMRGLLAWVIYPLACYAYLSAISVLGSEGKPRVNMFEDAHQIVPAAEMMRGERPYRDIVPLHGLIDDALLDYLLMRRGATNIGQIEKGRGTLTGLNAMAQYALGAAITGSAAGGALTFFLAAALGLGGGMLRVFPALLTLTLLVQATQRRSARLFTLAGALVVLSILNSLDFGAYAAVALIVALFRFPGNRRQALQRAALGVTLASLLTAVILLSAGILASSIRVTLTEIGRLAPAGTLPPFSAPPELMANHFVPEVLAKLFEKGAYLYLVWVAALVFVAVVFGMPAARESIRRRSRRESLVVLAAFAVVSAVSYAERHHLFLAFVTPALLVGTTFAVARSRARPLRLAAPMLTVALLMVAQPTLHLAIDASLRRQRGPLDSSLRQIAGVPRARGAFFRDTDAAIVEQANAYQSTRLAADETFFDFTNRSLFYYLFDRDCPIRQINVDFYESAELQREVIAAIEHNPRVRAALVPAPDEGIGLDGIPNTTRAPLVWQYLQRHFTPDYAEGGVVFWRRQLIDQNRVR